MRPAIALLLLLVAACQAAPLATGTPTISPAPPQPIPTTIIDGGTTTIFVDPSTTHQTIKDVTGGNLINVFSGTLEPLEPVSRYNLANLDVLVARVRMTLEAWEPVNDDADPTHINWSGYEVRGYNLATFQLMQELQARGSEIIATTWDLPDWLVADPSKDTQRFVPYDLYPEVVETIAAWLLVARDQYSVEPDYISFNEPDVGAYVSLAPFEMGNLIALAGARFDELGIRSQWLIADTSNVDGSAAFARSVLRNQDAAPYLGVFANHSWDSDSPDLDYLEVRDFARENGLEVWCTETGSNAFSWQTPEHFPTYEYAIELARIYSRVLKLTGATTLLYWEMMGSDYWINDGTKPYPAFHVIRQFGEQIPPGSTIVETSNNTETLYSVAAQAPAHFAVALVNTGQEPQGVILKGLPDGVYTHIQTTPNELETTLETYDVPSEEVTFKLPGMSIHVVTTRPVP